MVQTDYNNIGKEQIEPNKNFKKYCSITYTISHIIHGMYINAIGASIIILSENMNVEKTKFGPIFTFRGTGYLIGSYLTGFLEGKIDLHKLYQIGALLIAFSAISMTMVNNFLILLIIQFIGGLGCGSWEVLCNQLIVEVNKGGANLGPWLQFLHLGYGLGSILSPYLVAQISYETTFSLTAFLSILLILPLYMLKTPSTSSSSPQQNQPQENEQEQDQEIQQKNIQNYIDIPVPILIILATILSFDVGIEHGFGGWIPSYSNELGLNLQQSAYTGSLLWIGMSIGRIIALYTTKIIQPKQYLQFNLISAFFITFIFILSTKTQTVIYLFSLFLGFSFATVFPLIVQLPDDLQMNLKAKDTATMMIGAATLGDLVLPVIQGWLLDINTGYLIFSILVLIMLTYLGLIISLNQAKKYHKEQKKNTLDQQELKLMDNIIQN